MNKKTIASVASIITAAFVVFGGYTSIKTETGQPLMINKVHIAVFRHWKK